LARGRERRGMRQYRHMPQRRLQVDISLILSERRIPPGTPANCWVSASRREGSARRSSGLSKLAPPPALGQCLVGDQQGNEGRVVSGEPVVGIGALLDRALVGDADIARRANVQGQAILLDDGAVNIGPRWAR